MAQCVILFIMCITEFSFLFDDPCIPRHYLQKKHSYFNQHLAFYIWPSHIYLRCYLKYMCMYMTW